jgi:hypothetical protein
MSSNHMSDRIPRLDAYAPTALIRLYQTTIPMDESSHAAPRTVRLLTIPVSRIPGTDYFSNKVAENPKIPSCSAARRP